MRQQGKLRSWNEARGFGFIAPTGGGRELFVHISALSLDGGRPVPGETLSYELGHNAEGRPQALRVQRVALAGAALSRARPAARSRTASAPAGYGVATWLLIPGLLLLMLALGLAGRLPKAVPLVYLLASLLCFAAYARDKAAARQQGWRTPESTLHLLALLGGWPGALLAQQLLRHKTQKASFRATFWATVLGNGVGLLALAAAWPGR